jgi:Kef-type K+ transport system membrane component KefB
VALKISTLFAGLALGIACRWLEGRSRLTRVEFGGGADVFFIILFVSAGANLHVSEVLQYAPVALAFVLARSLAKVSVVYGCGIVFGHSSRRAVSAGLLLVPMAGLAIGLVQTTISLMPELGARVAAIVLAAVALFETVGPPIAAFAMRLSGEAGRAGNGPASVAAKAPVVAAATQDVAERGGPAR